MSKSLENEYKNLIACDIPDLWDRIESGLEERKPNETIINIDDKKVTKKKSSKRFLIYIPTLAMVAVAAMAIVPITLLNIIRNQSKTADFAASEVQMLAPQSFDAAEPMLEEATDSICEEPVEYESEMSMDKYTNGAAAVMGESKADVAIENTEAPTAEEDTDLAIWVEGAEIIIVSMKEEGDQTLVEVEYQGESILGRLSDKSLVEAKLNKEYIADIYVGRLEDGSEIYEYVLQSSRR